MAAEERPATGARLHLLDMTRGVAIVLMVIFHFTYDLNHFRFVTVDFYRDPFWLNFRTLILSLFLLVAGFSLQLATSGGIDRGRFLRRLGRVAGAAALVSAGTWIVFGDRMILFGVLHFIAVASVLGLLFRRLVWANLFLGIGFIALHLTYRSSVFNEPWLHWIGLVSRKPYTLDYVPLFPWFGVVLIGMFLGALALQRGWTRHPLALRPPRSLATRLLALGGRHSLLIYLLHQPLLFGGLYLFTLI